MAFEFMLMLLSITWLEMEMTCSQAIVQAQFIGETKIPVGAVHFGLKVSLIRIGNLLEKDLEWRLLLSLMAPMISTVPVP